MTANTDIDLILTLQSAMPRGREELEEQMFHVLGAVEEHGGDIAYGANVSCNFDDSSIELAFTVSAGSISESQSLGSQITAIIEQHTSIKFSGADASVREPEHEPVHALSC